MISAVTSNRVVNASNEPGAYGASSSTSCASLLPSPSQAPSDPVMMLYYCESKQQQFGLGESKTRLQTLQKDQQQALKKEMDAIRQHEEASKHKSFWDSLGSVCGEVAKAAAVVASVAAAVATCGAATPLAAVAIAGAVLSTAGFADGELHILQKLGVSDNVASVIDMTASIGGAVCSLGAGALAGASSAVGTASSVVGGVATIGVGASTIEAGRSQAEDDRAAADQVSAQANQDALRRVVLRLLTETKDDQEQSKEMLTTLSQTKTIQNQTMLAAATATEGMSGS